MSQVLLEFADFSVSYRAPGGMVPAVRGVSLQLRRGEVLGLLGESGSGKSTLAHAMMALLPGNAMTAGALRFEGRDMYALDEGGRQRLRGSRIAAVFQDPFTALNPVVRIGRQLEAFQHQMRGIGRAEKWRRAAEMLGRVGIGEPARRLRQYPFELSGGMRQRVAIAAALLCGPALLVADEPTTALDASTARQIVALLGACRALVDGAMVVVTHDLGVVARLCTHVAVMYAGQVMELGETAQVMGAPRHPYTRALLACDLASRGPGPGRVFAHIAGHVPDPRIAVEGCVFGPRCAARVDVCGVVGAPVVGHAGGFARCHVAA